MTTTLVQRRNQTITTAIAQYGQRLFHFIRSRVPSNADAEDVLQDVWFQFSKVIEIEPIEQVSAWLFRVARNRVTDRYRKRRLLLLDDLGPNHEDDRDGWLGEILADDSDDPEIEMLRELFWESLFEALDELPPAQRDVFVLNELEDMTLQQIAEKTDTNVKTIISRKRYAVQHLRKRLKSLYDEFLEF